MIASTMLEIVLPRLNQTYDIESKRLKIKTLGETISVPRGINIPVGIYIKISDSRFNSGYYKVVDKIKGGINYRHEYQLDRILTKGKETAVITLLAIPAGLDTIIGQMAKYARETAEVKVKSEKLPGMSITYFEEDLFKKFSGMLGAYRRLKTI